MKEQWEICYHALVCASPLPKWATQDDVIRAFQELDADLDCRMLTLERAWQLLPEWRQAALQFRCLEYYDPLEGRLRQEQSLEYLLEYSLRLDRTPVAATYRKQTEQAWMQGVVRHKLHDLALTPDSLEFRAALARAQERLGLPLAVLADAGRDLRPARRVRA